MGEAKRRRLKIEGVQRDIKISPRQRLVGFKVAHHRRYEQTGEDGTVYAVNVFSVIDDAGRAMFEETPDGPRPVLLQSVPQPVRRSVLSAAGLVGVSA